MACQTYNNQSTRRLFKRWPVKRELTVTCAIEVFTSVLTVPFDLDHLAAGHLNHRPLGILLQVVPDEVPRLWVDILPDVLAGVTDRQDVVVRTVLCVPVIEEH